MTSTLRIGIRAARLMLAIVLGAGGSAAMPARAQDVTVFAAASLTNVMQELGRAHQAAGAGALRFSFAASSALARQIEQGAPADIFVSADEPWMDYLAQRNLIVAATRTSPLSNRLVLVMPADRVRSVALAPGFDLRGLLGDGRLALGDPAHVPAGTYARAALMSLGLWEDARPRLAPAENVRAALLLVERGEAPAGIVYATDAAVAPGVRIAGTFPADSHPPITYPFAIVAGRDRPSVRAVFAFLIGPDARAAYARAGFAVRP